MEQAKRPLVLVVDDEPDIVFFLKSVLEDHGLRVITAFDGDEATEKLRQHKPDLISLDLLMPGKSGLRFFYELRKNKDWRTIPVLFVTGHADDVIDGSSLKEMLKERSLSGPATYLEKPINAQTYIGTVMAIIGMKGNLEEPKGEISLSLQEQIKNLIPQASEETLHKIMQILQKEKKN